MKHLEISGLRVSPVRPLRAVLFLVLALVCVSCSRGSGQDPFTLLRQEWDDILEFYTYEYPATDYAYFSLPADDPDSAAPRLLDCRIHTEILESAYNSFSKTKSVARLDDVISLRPEASGAADRYGYTAVPRFADANVSSVRAILSAHGIEPEAVSVKNPAPEGDVVAISYAGCSDENGYYVNPDRPVTLYVSAAKSAVFEPDPEGTNVVYLTFDDGPTEDGTEALLDILDTCGVKASFFTIGESIREHPASARLIAERGHSLGCHTVTHVYADIYASTDALRDEVVLWEQIVGEAGVTLPETKLFRFPGGSVGTYLTEESVAEMKAMLAERGYLCFDWNVVINDALLYLREEDTPALEYIRDTFEETFALCLEQIDNRPGIPIIVLMHEGVPETADLLPWLLRTLTNRGYSFGTLESYGRSWTYADRQ